MIHLEMLFLAASLLLKRRKIGMGGGAETFFNIVIWVGKEKSIFKESICQKIVFLCQNCLTVIFTVSFSSKL